MELSQLAGHELYPGEEVPAGGIITGIGAVKVDVASIVFEPTLFYFFFIFCRAALA